MISRHRKYQVLQKMDIGASNGREHIDMNYLVHAYNDNLEHTDTSYIYIIT